MLNASLSLDAECARRPFGLRSISLWLSVSNILSFIYYVCDRAAEEMKSFCFWTQGRERKMNETLQCDENLKRCETQRDETSSSLHKQAGLQLAQLQGCRITIRADNYWPKYIDKLRANYNWLTLLWYCSFSAHWPLKFIIKSILKSQTVLVYVVMLVILLCLCCSCGQTGYQDDV